MLDIARIAPEFWLVAVELKADLLYVGPADESPRGHHWSPGGGRCYVYVLSNGGIPVYIGKSYDPHARFEAHRKREWWPEAEHLSVFQVLGDDRADAGRRALSLEAAAIRYMHPLYNIAGVA